MDRSAKIVIDGQEYELLLTTKAFEEIAERYGGIDKLGDKLMEGKSLSEIIWLIVLLANQSILRHNFKNKDNPITLLTEEDVALFTTPYDFTTYQEAIGAALQKGMDRNVKSEEEPSKNAEVG